MYDKFCIVGMKLKPTCWEGLSTEVLNSKHLRITKEARVGQGH